jgi:hypothetical protein
MKTIEINEFRGQVVGLDSVDLKPSLATNASGVDVKRRGELLPMTGMEKWSTFGLSAQIDSIHQLGGSSSPNTNLFTVSGGTVYRGPEYLVWDSSADATEPTEVIRSFYFDFENRWLYLAQANKIVRQRWDGSSRTTYGSSGTGQDQFQYINTITMDDDGYLHIIDNDTNWIKVKFGGEGWDKIDINPEGFAYVRDIFYSADTGYFYLTDYSTDEIVECDRAFTHDVRMDYGWENMTAAVYSATGYQGEPRVVFCETDSDYVCATTLDVTDRDYIGASWAPHAGELSSPSGIAEYDGHFYVSDAGNDRIVRFEMSGAGWATYLTSGSGSQQCALPRRIQIDSNTGNLYFLDYFNKRIGKFSTENFN